MIRISKPIPRHYRYEIQRLRSEDSALHVDGYDAHGTSICARHTQNRFRSIYESRAS